MYVILCRWYYLTRVSKTFQSCRLRLAWLVRLWSSTKIPFLPCVQVSHHLNITNNNCWFSLMNPKIVVVPKSFFYFYCLVWADNYKLRTCWARPTHENPIPMSHHPSFFCCYKSLVLRFLLQPYDFCGSHLLLMRNDVLRLLVIIIFWLQIEQSTSKTYCDIYSSFYTRKHTY